MADVAIPWPLKGCDQLIGWRLTGFEPARERLQRCRLIALTFWPGDRPPTQARLSHCQQFTGNIEHRPTRNLCTQAEPRHVAKQLLPVRRRPARDQVRRRLQAIGVIEQAGPEGGQGNDVINRPGIAAAHFEE